MRPINLDEEKTEETHVDLRQEDAHKRLNIHTFMAHDDEVIIGGTDESGEELCMWFKSHNFLDWINNDQIEYIKQKLIDYIDKK